MSDRNNFDDMPLPDWLSGGSFDDDDDTPSPPPPPADEPEEALPDWLSGEARPSEAKLDDEEYHFEEYAGVPPRQDEALPEPDLELPSLEDLTGGTEGGASSADYVPDWFMGLEEQNLDEAPDWVKDADSVDDLTDLSAFEEEVPSFAEIAGPDTIIEQDEADSAVPDWFGSDDTNWFDDEPNEMAAPTLPDLDEPDTVNEDDFLREQALAEQDQFDFGDSFDLGATEEDEELDFLSEEMPAALPDDLEQLLGDIEAGSMAADDDTFDFLDEEDEVLDDFGDLIAEVDSSASDSFEIEDMEWDIGEHELVEAPQEQDIDLDIFDSFDESEDDDFDLGPILAAEEADDEFDLDLDLDEDALEEIDLAAALEDDSLTVERGGTQRMISEMQTSSLDIEALLGDETAETGLVPASQLPQSSPLDLASEDLFAGVDEELFESLTPVPAGEPGLSLAEEDDLDLGELPTYADAEEEAIDLAEVPSPEWVEDLRPDMPVNLKAGNLEFEFDQTRLSEMSEELRALRERSAALSARVQEEERLAGEEGVRSGPLAGIVGGLRASEMIPDVTPALTTGGELEISSEQQRQIEYLQSALAVISREAASRREGDVVIPEPVKVRTRARPKLDRLVVTLILLVLMILPFINDSFHLDSLDGPDEGRLIGKRRAVVSAVDELEAGDYVFVAFEYGPTAANELNPLAEAVLRDVIKQGAVPIVTSTSPLGALNSRLVFNDLIEDETLLSALDRERPLVSRQHYILLPYIAGDAVGVRTLTRSENLSNLLFQRDFEGRATDLDFDTFDPEDVAMVLVIGETLEDARRWAEQLPDEDFQKYILTTAAAEPLVATYVGDEMGYRGLLAGYRDTYRYNHQRNPEAIKAVDSDIDLPDNNAARWYSLNIGMLAVLAVIALGFVVNILRLGRQR